MDKKIRKSIPEGRFECEMTVRNSKFIGLGAKVCDPEEARELIRHTREAHPGCSHVVYAFITGGDRTEVSGMSDDGEPKGTAGRPVMEVLKGSGIVDAIVMVVRYFGGTKLGTGGLVKAYGDCAKEVVAGLPVRPLIEMLHISIEVPYNIHRQVREAIVAAGGEIQQEDFGDNILLKGAIPESSAASLRREIEEISRGGLTF